MGEGTMGPYFVFYFLYFVLKDGQKEKKKQGYLSPSILTPNTFPKSQVRQYGKQSFTLKNLAKEQTT